MGKRPRAWVMEVGEIKRHGLPPPRRTEVAKGR